MILFSCTSSGRLTRQPVQIGRPSVPLIDVLLSESPILSIRLHGTYYLQASEGNYQISSSSSEFFAFFDNGILNFRSDKRSFAFKSGFPVVLIPKGTSDYFEMEGKRYKGRLYIYKISEDHIAYILRVDLENYLLGVIPAEIPTGNPDYLAAIEAQTIAARSYAYYKYVKNKNSLFTLYDDQRDQVLGDMLKANENTRKAIRATRGMILVSATDKEFVPYYHSTCGGYFYELPDEKRIVLDGTDPNSEAYCSVSPLYRWHRVMDIRDLIESLEKNKKFRADDGFFSNKHVIRMSIQVRDSAGRVQKMAIQIDNQTIFLSDYEIRKVFVDSLAKPLPSTWFFLAPFSQDSLKFLIVGSGYGHGKGMCQWGAIGMSLQGFSVLDILNHYYPHAMIRRLYR
jgi:stage II sporulation protein D